ncbi:hypothetical protein CfE428DRAFT_5808 [Chthoniobacter flavus Ellin428]|uniref:Uncharacterized protein n=1 Tax=Chthoniobacter flavus Ellin428 TaxID=497964 RepID=B4DA68_9BACT|nr:hypothetical protein [Chthoniobacter flavus]EDY16695.1 hypothetical protein CfE428DRAFT_5808 [Chthoniobacter flavus Ellin428]
MSRKPRSDSLWAALKTEENRSQVFEWLILEGISYEDCAARCAESFGFSPSTGALATFYKDHAFAWKIERAKLQAEEEKGKLPGDWEERVREALAQRRFEASFQELSQKQIIALERLDLDKRKVDLTAQDFALARQKFQRDTCKLFLEWCDQEQAKKIVASGMSNSEKIEQLGLAMFGEDWNA